MPRTPSVAMARNQTSMTGPNTAPTVWKTNRRRGSRQLRLKRRAAAS
jgi:hypothetical protein